MLPVNHKPHLHPCSALSATTRSHAQELTELNELHSPYLSSVPRFSKEVPQPAAPHPAIYAQPGSAGTLMARDLARDLARAMCTPVLQRISIGSVCYSMQVMLARCGSDKRT